MFPYWRWVDEFIDDDLGGTHGVYDWFNWRLCQWAKTKKKYNLSGWQATQLLQQHKQQMAAAKYTIFCWTDGPGAIWEVCGPSKGLTAWIVNIDRNTRRIARDGIARALVIARSTPATKAQVEHEVKVDIATLNLLRMRHHLQEFNADKILARTGIF